ncbi:MAG: T9SS type A sorting domain-containing protein [Bacteroidota bacterium]
MKKSVIISIPHPVKHYPFTIKAINIVRPFCLFVCLLCTISSVAQKEWNGLIDGNWHNPINWVGFDPPATNSKVVVLGSAPNQPIISTGSVTIQSITIESGTTLTISNGASLTLNTGNDDALLNEGTVDNSGSIDINRFAGTSNVDGIENEGTFNNYASGYIAIDEVSEAGIYNVNGTFNNEGRIEISKDAPVGSIWDIANNADFNNIGCSSLIICHAKSIVSSGTFTNDGNIVEKYGGNSNITVNTGVVQNLNGGSFFILNNNGLLTTASGKIWTRCIGSNWQTDDNWHTLEKPTSGDTVQIYSNFGNCAVPNNSNAFAKNVRVRPNAVFTNNGTLKISNSAADGIYNQGNITNNKNMEIGLDGAIGQNGIDNRGTFNNSAQGSISIDGTGDDAIYNELGSFTNSGDIGIGGSNIGGNGVYNNTTFTNEANASIIISDLKLSSVNGVDNKANGNFSNLGTLQLAGGSSTGIIGIKNEGVMSNGTLASILLDNSFIGINNVQGNFTNSGEIKLGSNIKIEGFGLTNAAVFQNLADGIVTIDNIDTQDAIWNEDTGTFTNQGQIVIGETSPPGALAIENDGTFDNTLCQALVHIYGSNIQDNGTFYNAGAIIEEASGNSNIATNDGDVLNLNGGTFSIGGGNAAISDPNKSIWRGCISEDWDDPNNWLPMAIPSAGKRVEILDKPTSPWIDGGVVAVATTVTIKNNASLLIDYGGTLSIEGSDTGLVVMDNAYLDISTGATLQIENIIDGIINYGDIDNYGVVKIGFVGSGASITGLKNYGVLQNVGNFRVKYASTAIINHQNITIDDGGTINIGINGEITNGGIENYGNFNNIIGDVNIDNCIQTGIRLKGGTFTNNSTITIGLNGGITGQTGGQGIFLEDGNANFVNTNGGSVNIKNITGEGISVESGTILTNAGTLNIGQNLTVGNISSHGIKNSGSVDNNSGGIINIDNTADHGIFNDHTFDNSATINIGQNGTSIGGDGIHNEDNFDNQSGGTININNTAGEGILVENGASQINAGTLNIGQNQVGTNISNHAIRIAGLVNNSTGGIINIDNTTIHAIFNENGTFNNTATINIGQNLGNIGGDGINNQDDFNNNSGGEIKIDETAGTSIYNTGSFTNIAAIDIGLNEGNIGMDGIKNEDVFENGTGGLIYVEDTGANGVNNEGTFTNAGPLYIDYTADNGIQVIGSGTFTNTAAINIGQNGGNIGNHGIKNRSLFENNSGGNIYIDETSKDGILSDGTFANAATINIGQSGGGSIGDEGIDNRAVFTNNIGGVINIDYAGNPGLHARLGTFTNHSDINIGVLGTNLHGVQIDESDFINGNNGHIRIENSGSSAVIVAATIGSLTNNGILEIGQNGGVGNISANGISNFGMVTNEGYIQIDNTSYDGINIGDGGTFINDAILDIGQNDGNIEESGILIENGTFYNNANGTINIDNTTGDGLVTRRGQTINQNGGNILIGTIGNIGGYGIEILNYGNPAVLSNLDCSIIRILSNNSINNTGTINNDGLLSFNTSQPHLNPGTFNNTGVVQNNLDNPIPNVSNNGIVIDPYFSCSTVSTDVLQLGAGNGYTILGEWFKDPGLNNKAGDYSQANNTFTVTNLPHGLHTLYFTVSGNGCNFDASIAFDYQLEGSRTWTGTISTAWNEDGNWLPKCAPTSNDFVIIPSTGNAPIIANGVSVVVKSAKVENGGSLTVAAGGSLNIDDAVDISLENLGTVDNFGNISIGQIFGVRDEGVNNKGTFNNNGGATLAIDNTDGRGLVNEGGTFTNAATIDIGQNSPSVVTTLGAENWSTFNNYGTINIDRYGDALRNQDGTFTNEAILNIGENAGSGNIPGLGLVNESVFNNANGGQIHISNVGENAILNTNDFNNESIINIGQNGIIGDNGIYNIAEFDQIGTGVINIVNTTNDGIYNRVDGTWINEGTISVGVGGTANNIGGQGIFNDHDFDNINGGEIITDNTSAEGISNSDNGTFTNDGSIDIGQNGGAGNSSHGGIRNHNIFINNGDIHIDNTVTEGINNFVSGTITNNSTINIGQKNGVSIGSLGILNSGTFNNENGSSLLIDNTNNSGISNLPAGSFTNKGAVNIGQNGGTANITFAGISNLGTFNNENGGSLSVDNTDKSGVDNFSVFINKGTINIGENGGAGNIGQAGIFNTSNFTNNSGNISIDNTTEDGIRHVNGIFTNESQIEIGLNSSQANLNGIYNDALFENKNGGIIDIYHFDTGLKNENEFINETGASVYSQGAVNVSTSTSFMTNHGTMTTDMGISIIQDATVQGDGTYALVTEWLNNGTFLPGTSTVKMTGGTNTEIIGTAPTTFYNLTMEKSTNEVVLEQNIQVDNELQMVSNHLNLNGHDLTLGNSNGTIEGESASTYIYCNNGGEVIKTAPLDSPFDVNPGNIGVSISSPELMGMTTIKRGHIPQTVNGTSGMARYYDISPANNNNLGAIVKFYYFDHELNGNTEADLSPYRFNGSTWEEYTVSDSDPTENYVETNNVASFSLWTLASGASLPVELVYFQATATEDQKVKLSWQTASEKNNDFFLIERSSDGQFFSTIEKVNGAGNADDVIDYETYDEQPFTGINYYRLKQVDFDGTFAYSPIRSVVFNRRETLVSIYPNPVSNVANVQLPTNIEMAALQVFDAGGRMVFAQENMEQSSFLQLNVQDWKAGAYVLQVQVDQQTFTHKLIVNHN